MTRNVFGARAEHGDDELRRAAGDGVVGVEADDGVVARRRVNARAVLRFSAFNQRTTPEINGLVTKISADITQGPKTGASFYTLRITMSPAEVGRLNGFKLIPCMPVETFVQTSERTVMSYLVKPLHDQVMKAFRER